MVRKLVVSMLAVVPLALAACSVGEDDAARPLKSTSTSTSTTTPGSTSTSSTTSTTTVATTTTTGRPPAAPHFVCPDGGLDAIRELQDAIDQGHQPWRLSAPDVAAACTFGIPGTQVQAVGHNRYKVVHSSTGRSAIVDLAQPLGRGTIWVATAVAYSTAASAARCTSEAMLPVVRAALEPPHVAAIKITQCHGGYARLVAIPDNATCGRPGAPCWESEQVFLADHGGRWTFLTAGTGISCGTDNDLPASLLTACKALGLR